jgi:riboflavin kinase/FMN adenylyltransferase
MGPLVTDQAFVVAVDPTEPPPGLTQAIYAIGNFDGVHRGHRAVLTRAAALAREAGTACAVLTFEPHPADYFAQSPVVFRLTPFEEKAAALAACGVDGLVNLSFGADLAGLSAQAFVEDVLVKRLRASAVVVGADFHFGKGRSGSPAYLRRAGEELGFRVIVADKVEEQGESLSSTLIRRALERGDVGAAAHMLGRPYRVGGEVIGGQQLGRTLGVPTANIALPATNRLAFGVYAVNVHVGDRVYGGVASFGVRPTVDNGPPLLETYILDFSQDIYGRHIEVEFTAYLRPELKFDGLAALKSAMAKDISDARQVWDRQVWERQGQATP